jgi:rod shape-determining protein MreC
VLTPGQQVVTYASVGDQPQVPGVPVGTVVSVSGGAGALTQTAVIRPFADFSALGVVGVVIEVPRHNPRVSILPRPAPTVTVTTTPRAAPSTSPYPFTPPAAGSAASPVSSATASPTAGG